MREKEMRFTRLIYSKVKDSKPSEYRLIENKLQGSILPPIINLEPDKVKSKIYKEWVYTYNCPSWKNKNPITGLIPTGLPNIFEGKIKESTKEKESKNLAFFEFSKNRDLLAIDVFLDFYTDNPFAFKSLIETHKFLFNRKASYGKAGL